MTGVQVNRHSYLEPCDTARSLPPYAAPPVLNVCPRGISVRNMRVFALIAVAAAFGSSACRNANQSGPAAMGSGATINGAIIAEDGFATKHSGGSGSATVPGLVVSVAGTNISGPVDRADQFTLRGVPSGSVSLVFTAPGLHGAIGLSDLQDGDAVEVGVTVSGSTIALDSRRRQRGRDIELEGRVAALPPTTAPGTFIIAGRHVTTTEATRYGARGDDRVSFRDLEVGMRVLVTGGRRNDSLVASSVLMHLRQ